MNRDVPLERISDPTLAAALADLREDTPDDVDWDRLRSSINEKAAITLARKRARKMVLRRRPLLPMAAAAMIAFALWMSPGILSNLSAPGPFAETNVPIDEEQLLVEVLDGDLTEQEFRLLVTGRAYPEVLLAFAISDP